MRHGNVTGGGLALRGEQQRRRDRPPAPPAEDPGDCGVALVVRADAAVDAGTVGRLVVQSVEFEPVEGAEVTFADLDGTILAGCLAALAADGLTLAVPVDGGRWVAS